MIEYYERNGWLDFLVEIAKTKVFDIGGSGLNSIECAKRASGYDVLSYASVEKEKNTALGSLYKK